MVDVMGRKFKPLFPGEHEEWEGGSGYGDEEDEFEWCPMCGDLVEIETVLRSDGLYNRCMECGTETEER